MQQLIRPLLIAGIGAVGMAALIAIAAVLTGDFGEFQLKVLATVGVISFYSFTSAATFGEGKEYQILGIAGAGLAVVGLMLSLPEIWITHTHSEATWKAIISIGILSFSLGHATVNYRLSSSFSASMAVMALSNVAVAIVTSLLLYLILGEFRDLSETFVRFLIVSSITDVALTLINFMVGRIRWENTSRA